jgi:UDP-N-acetylglucosamine diphosphorylase / glucose-1-phosphate thymidylyltransferase / UDP-N-acetylgalactosamine diphosphorylase / glucosamine-1-phosphate N-acetyltransferase / galactosamine-1-phosphate N-acetyltransferase
MAAWEGSRMRPLTDNTPKPLLKICWKTLIEHNIESIIDHFDEIYFVIKYKKEAFPVYFGETYHWKKVHYIEQVWDVMGTGAAILSLKGVLKGDFVVVSWDDIYDSQDIIKLSKSHGPSALAKSVDKPENFWIFHCDKKGKPLSIVEKPTDVTLGNLAYIGILKESSDIFEELASLPLSPRGELEITDLMARQMERGEFSVVEAKGRWITIGYPWDLLKANDEIIGGYMESHDKWAVIEPNVTIKWNIYLEEWVILKSGTYIEGNVYFWRNCEVGPYTHIRWNTSFGADTKAWSFSEIKWCYFADDTVVAQSTVIVDTVAGMDVNFWSGTITTNWRHDNTNIKAMSKWKLVDTGRRKFGSIVGDNVRFGANTTIYPGRTIPSDWTTLPGEIVK